MVAGQRRTHKGIWLVMAIVIPILVYFSIKDLSFASEVQSESESHNLPLAKVLQEADNEYFKVQIIQEKRGKALHIIRKKPLKGASAIGYVYNQDERVVLPGQLDESSTRYTYTFKEGARGYSDAKGIVVIDPIRNLELFKIEF